ncbi:phenylacetate--CoA ligase family protein [Dongia sp.]|uniref:phenylacetate--CoA ligase family protein n=1 Tax=Dongia sp. TaxID=1977262 RepID=UPI0035AF8D66
MDARNHFLETSLDDLLHPGETGDGFAQLEALLERVARDVPAYRQILKEKAIDPATIRNPADFARLPLLDKANYIRRFGQDELVPGGDRGRCDFYAVSSGSTGEPTFWPRAAADEYPIATRFEQVFRDAFAAHEKRTLAVVCFALGTWVGGMFTTFCLRALAEKGYRIMIATPGNKPEEILRTVERLAPQFDQTVLLGYPPFLKEVIDAGIGQELDWGRCNIRLVLAGEVFSETWRDLVAERAGTKDILTFAASLYGTADAGVLAQETPLSVAIRRFLSGRPDIAMGIFGEARLPTLCQYDPASRYFEVVDGTLAFSGDNGVPLIRYHIADRGGIMAHEKMLRRLGDAGFSPQAAGVETFRRQPFVWVFGRANFTISYFGANIFPETVSLGLEQKDVHGFVTGKFVMQVKEGIEGKPAFTLAVEMAHNMAMESAIAERVADEVLAALRRLNSEFANYVPVELQRPIVTLFPQGHPEYFPVGVKHRYSR